MKAPIKLVISTACALMLLATAYGQSETIELPTFIELPSEELDRYVGTYSRIEPQEATYLEGRGDVTVTSDGTALKVYVEGIRAYSETSQPFFPTSSTRFVRMTSRFQGVLQFELNDDGVVTRLIFSPALIEQDVMLERID